MRYFFALISLFFSTTVLAQEGVPFIEKVVQIKGGSTDQVGCISSTSDGSIYVPINMESDSFQIGSTNFAEPWRKEKIFSDFCLVKFTPELEVDSIYFVDYDITAYTRYSDDEFLWVAGYKTTGYATPLRMFFGKYNLEGKEIWTNQISTDFDRSILFSEKSKSFYFIGSYQYSWSYDSIRFKYIDENLTFVVGKIDSLGKLAWVKPISGNAKRMFSAYYVDSDDNLTFTIEHSCDTLVVDKKEIIMPESSKYEKYISFIKLSPKGELLDYHHLYGKDLITWHPVMIFEENCYYSSVTFAKELYFDQDSIEKKSRFNLIKLNMSGKIEWVVGTYQQIWNLMTLSDHSFVGFIELGPEETENIDGYIIKNETAKYISYIIKIDENGKVIKHQPIGGKINLNMTSISTTTDFNRINVYVNATDSVEVEWYNKVQKACFFYCSFSNDLEKMDFKKLGEYSVNIEYNSIYTVPLDENRVIGSFSLRSKSMIFDQINYNNSSTEDEDFIFIMNLNDDTNNVNDLKINKLDLTPLLVYPNPFTSEVQIDFSEESGHLKIFNIKGVKVFENTVLSSESINLSDLSSGVYIITLKTENRTYLGKIVKN